jgi:dienelactone hydrolase
VQINRDVVSDEVFETYRTLFDFDPVPLESSTGNVVESSTWRRERITFRAAYADEDVVAYLFLPVTHEPPYQTVVYFPGAAAMVQKSPDELQMGFIDFLIASGRAVMYPIYWGTYERRSERVRSGTRAVLDRTTYRINDLTRSIDYLETRADIRADLLAYQGFSWGGSLGPRVLALEPRFRTAVLLDGGMSMSRFRPEIQRQHYATRVKTPVLMVNGLHDSTFPVESSQKVLFDLLGTSPEHKKHVILPGGHVVMSLYRNQTIAEVLDWLDTYLGPVK